MTEQRNAMRPLVGSYTLLNTYDICPHQAYRRMVAKDIPFVETAEMSHGSKVHAGMEKRIKTGHVIYPEYEPFVAAFIPYGPHAEVKMGIRSNGEPCDFFAGDVWFRGKLDVVVTWEANAFIGDWKTGKVRENADELELFGVMLKARQPNLQKITGSYIWLKTGTIGQKYDLSDTAGKFRSLASRMDELHNAQKFDHWPKQEGPLCAWCSVLDCEFNRKP